MLIAAKSSFEGSAQRGSLILSSPFYWRNFPNEYSESSPKYNLKNS